MVLSDISSPRTETDETGDDLGKEVFVAPVSFDQVNPGNAAYNNPRLARITGRLNVATLEQSIREIIRRHESLRTTFATEQMEPVQVIY